MAIILPNTLANSKLIRRGQARIFFGTYTANGADASSFTFLGGRSAKTSFAFSRKYHEIMLEDFLNAVDAQVSGEELKIQCGFGQMTLEKYRELLGSLGLTLTGGTDGATSGSLGLGEDTTTTFRQLVIKTPAPPAYGSAVAGYIQLWKCYPTTTGPLEFAKDGHTTCNVTFHALCDETAIAAGKGGLGVYIDQ